MKMKVSLISLFCSLAFVFSAHADVEATRASLKAGGDVVEKGKQALQSVQATKQKAEELILQGKKLKGSVEEKINQAKGMYEQAKNTVEQAKGKIEEVKNTVEDVKNKATGIVDEAKSKVEDVKNKATGIVDEAKSKVEGYKDQATGFAENAKNTFEGYKDQAIEAYNQGREDITGMVKGENADSLDWSSLDDEVESQDSGKSNADSLSLPQKDLKEEKEAGPKAFDRVSYNTYHAMSYAQESSGLYTGTDNDGNYYFPDELAGWCKMNFDADFDGLAEGCILQICRDFNNEDAEIADTNRQRFDVIEMDAVTHNMVVAMQVKQKYATDKAIDDTKSKMVAAQESEKDLLSGLITLDPLFVEQARDANLLKAGELELTAYDGIRNYCGHFSESDDSDDFGDDYQGTDSDGNYYFPDRLADWCTINANENVDESTAEECILEICQNYNLENAEEAAIERQHFDRLELEALTHNFAFALNMKKKYATDETTDETEKTQDESEDTVHDEVSGLSSLNGLFLELKQDEDLMKASELEMSVYQGMRVYCESMKGEKK